MPPKKATGDATKVGPSGLTEGELRFIKAIFDNMTQKPDADWTKVAVDLGLKDAKCAKERFRQMSVRHEWRDQSAPSPSPRKGKGGAAGVVGDVKVAKKPRTPRKKAKKEESPDGDVKSEDGEDKNVVKMEDEDEDEAEVDSSGEV